MDISNVKRIIQSAIKTNNTQDITGDTLQQVLLSLASSFENVQEFAGIVSPSSSPSAGTENKIYVAMEYGTYTAFNNTTLAKGEVAVFVYRKGSSTPEVQKAIITMPDLVVDKLLNELSTNPIQNGVVAKELKKLSEALTTKVDLETFRNKLKELNTSIAEAKNDSVKKVVVQSASSLPQEYSPDKDGTVSINIPDSVVVDDSLNEDSTNAIQNGAVARKLNGIDDKLVADVQIEEEGGTNTLKLLNGKGQTVASAEFTGGSGGEGNATRIILNVQVDKALVQEGGTAKLTYFYDHVDKDGVSDGAKATISIVISKGTTQLYSGEYTGITSGTRELDLTKYLAVGNIDITVKASVLTADGTTQNKQRVVSISVAQLTLLSSYNLSTKISDGGYSDSDVIEIPYILQGSGTKTVSMYLDGSNIPEIQERLTNSTVRGSFRILGSSLRPGRHTVQLVANRINGNGEIVLTSKSIHIDILKKGAEVDFIGMMVTNSSGTIRFGNDHLTPTISAEQFESVTWNWIAYSQNNVPATVVMSIDDTESNRFSVDRSVQTAVKTFSESGAKRIAYKIGAITYNAVADVKKSAISASAATSGLVFKLSPDGRNNSESQKHIWSNNGVETQFQNVDWNASGWNNGGALTLRNGAKAIIGYKPFDGRANIKQNGFTLEVEIRVSNAADRESSVLSCFNGNLGFRITSEEAAFYTGSTQFINTEDGGRVEQPVGIAMKFGPEHWYKIAFVVHPSTSGNLMELYINGIRSKADIYASSDSFMQNDPQNIIIDSTNADVDIRNIRVYKRPLADDECVDNMIVDRSTNEERLALNSKNLVLNDLGHIDIDKIIGGGKGAILVIRQGGLQPINAENDKKAKFSCDKIIMYTPWGDIIEIRNGIMTIQGTSSTKYPRKNYRIYSAKDGSTEVWIKQNGKTEFEKIENRLFPMFKNDPHPVKVATAKADYSDSSMTHNTGLAQVWNDTMKAMGILTPAQKVDSSYRTSIYGYPIDIFSAETETGERAYWGQYNLNNDKSNWENVIGLKGVAGIDNSKVISLEFLNNSERIGNFDIDANAEAQFDAEFGNALEFNWPKDTEWKDANELGGKKNATPEQKKAILDLWKWVRDCVPAGADKAEHKNIQSFVSAKFKNEAKDHFKVKQLLSWFIFTDYFAMVDQRVKNMMWHTWDLKEWWLEYYDGDTSLLLDNTSFLKYLYTLSRETWDSLSSKYAFEGHNSNLWCLVLANFSEELKTVANDMRAVISIIEGSGKVNVLNVLNKTIMGNWSERQYNKSGKIKYIDPLIEGVMVKGQLTKYNFIYALQGSREAHRTHTLINRFALLDAKYQTSSFRADAVELYINREASAPESTAVVTSAEDYYFGYGTKNHANLQEASRAGENETVTMRFRGAMTQNDPVSIYGASRIRAIDLRGINGQIVSSINFDKCSVLREINMRTENGVYNQGFFTLAGCRQIKKLDVYGQLRARTSSASSEIDLTNQTRIEYVDAGHTEAQSVVIANGAPISYLRLPNTLTSLVLRHLNELTDSGLVVEGYSNITKFVFESCAKLDGLKLINRCENLKFARITGIALSGDGSDLKDIMSRRIKGIDSEGNITPDKCKIVGSYKLNKYMDEDEYSELSAYFDELDLRQPEYTGIYMYMDTPVAVNVYNMDNGTGYPASEYKPSGHVAKILNARKKQVVLINNQKAEYAYKDVRMAEIPNQAFEFSLNTVDKPNILDKDGHIMMYEPGYWYKGVNDYFGRKNYLFVSTNKEKPSVHSSTKVLQPTSTKSGKAVSDSSIISLTNSIGNSVLNVNVSGYKQVRFYVVPETNSCFTDDSGNVIPFNTSGDKFIRGSAGDLTPTGMYIIVNVPEGATQLYATMSKDDASKSDAIVASKSDKIVDMEPEWLRCDERLMSIGPATYIGGEVECKDISRYNSNGNTIQKTFEHDINFGLYLTENSGFENLDCAVWFNLIRLGILSGNRRLFKPDVLGYKLVRTIIPKDANFVAVNGDPNYIGVYLSGTLVNFYEGFRNPINGDNSYRTRPKYVRWGKYCLPLFAGTDYAQQSNTYFGAEVASTPSVSPVSILGHYYTGTQTLFTYGQAISYNTLYPNINLSKVKSVTRVDYDKF